jgi:hypothetical protein
MVSAQVSGLMTVWTVTVFTPRSQKNGRSEHSGRDLRAGGLLDATSVPKRCKWEHLV